MPLAVAALTLAVESLQWGQTIAQLQFPTASSSILGQALCHSRSYRKGRRRQNLHSWVGLNSRSWFLREEEEGKIGLLDLASEIYKVLVKFEFQITNNYRARKIMNLQGWKMKSIRHIFDAQLCAKYSARWCVREKILSSWGWRSQRHTGKDFSNDHILKLF